MDHRLQLDVVGEPTGLRPLGSERRVQEAADVLAAGIDPALGQLHGSVGGEQVRDVVPAVLVDVVAVSVLKVLQFVEGFDPAHQGFDALDAGGAGWTCGAWRAGDREEPRRRELGRIARHGAGHRIGEVEKRHMGLGIDRIGAGGRPVRRGLAARPGRRLGILAPAPVVVGDEARIEAQSADFPDALLLDEHVLVDAVLPRAPAAVGSGHGQLVQARVAQRGGQIDDRLQLQMVE